MSPYAEQYQGNNDPVNLTAEEAARILGGLSVRTVYRYGSYLGARRFGRSVRFDRETVLRVAFEGLPQGAKPAPPHGNGADVNPVT